MAGFPRIALLAGSTGVSPVPRIARYGRDARAAKCRGYLLHAALIGLIIVIAIASPVRAQTPATQPTTRPSVTLSLDVKQLNHHPGFSVVKGQGQIGDRIFPFACGIFLPPIFDTQKTGLPIVMTLHNRGDSGSGGGNNITREGLGMMLRTSWPDAKNSGAAPEHPLNLRKDAKFIGVVPQCPDGFDWSTPGMPDFLCRLIDQISQAYQADDDRVYLTGFSYGASNTWLVAMARPDRFAAIAVMDGRASPHPAEDVARLKDVAIYLNVGQWDGPFDAAADRMHEALTNLPHRNFVWNIVDNGNHWCYYSVYRNPHFWDWLLAQRRHRSPDPS